jgi:hypothetical protein
MSPPRSLMGNILDLK